LLPTGSSASEQSQALGDFSLTRSQCEESLALAMRLDDRIGVAWSQYQLGCLALDEDDRTAARAWLRKGIAFFPEFDRLGQMYELAGFSALAAAEGQPQAALRLAGAIAALTEGTGIQIQPTDRLRYERQLAYARHALDEDSAEAAWTEGHAMGLDQAVAYALAPQEPPGASANAPAKPRPDRTCGQLTPRQQEVAALIALGLTNRQVAAPLVITDRTAAAHVEQIKDKLGFASRTQIGVWASEHRLRPDDVI
jgi:DNA-binding CsgD family transcriptional regulator